MVGVVFVTSVVKVVNVSDPNDIKGLLPATSSDFKIVKITNDCGQPTLATGAFKTATDQLVGNVDFIPSGSKYTMKLSHIGTEVDAGIFSLKDNTLYGTFNIPAITDGLGDNISISSNGFTYSFNP